MEVFKIGELVQQGSNLALHVVEDIKSYWDKDNFFKVLHKSIKKENTFFYRFNNSLTEPEYVCLKFVNGRSQWLRKSTDKEQFFSDIPDKKVEIFCLDRRAYDELVEIFRHNDSYNPDVLNAIYYKNDDRSFVLFYFKFSPYPMGVGNSGGVKIPNN